MTLDGEANLGAEREGSGEEDGDSLSGWGKLVNAWSRPVRNDIHGERSFEQTGVWIEVGQSQIHIERFGAGTRNAYGITLWWIGGRFFDIPSYFNFAKGICPKRPSAGFSQD